MCRRRVLWIDEKASEVTVPQAPCARWRSRDRSRPPTGCHPEGLRLRCPTPNLGHATTIHQDPSFSRWRQRTGLAAEGTGRKRVSPATRRAAHETSRSAAASETGFARRARASKPRVKTKTGRRVRSRRKARPPTSGLRWKSPPNPHASVFWRITLQNIRHGKRIM